MNESRISRPFIRRSARAVVGSLVVASMLLIPVHPADAATTATVCLYNSSGQGIAGADASFRSGGWQSMGLTGADGCVSTDSPAAVGRIRFRLTYGGQRQVIRQDTRVDPVVVFQTVAVTVRLIDSGGVDGIEGATVTYNASGWQTFGTTDANGSATSEMFPANIRFRLSYGGRTQDVTQDTSVDPVISYQTGQVLQGTGLRIVTYQASGWIPFNDGVEMLPGSVRFRFDDGSRAYHTISPGTVNYVPTAPTPPVVTVTDASIDEGDDFALAASFVDQEASQTHRASIDWGDGSGIEAGTVVQPDGLTGMVTATHNYPNGGVHPVQVCVTDDGNPDAQGCQTFSLTVVNVAPVATITPPPDAATEGGEVVLSSSVTDPGALDVISYVWSVAFDGESFASGTDPGLSFTPLDDGDYSVSLTVDDGDGGANTQTLSLTVANVAPVATISPPPDAATEGSEVALTATASDPGSLDVMSYLWSATSGGEVVATGTEPAFSFTPVEAGDYTVSLTVDDGDGGVATTLVGLAVAALPPPPPVEPDPVQQEPEPAPPEPEPAQPEPDPMPEESEPAQLEPVDEAPEPPAPPAAAIEPVDVADEPREVSPEVWARLASETAEAPKPLARVELPKPVQAPVPVPAQNLFVAPALTTPQAPSPFTAASSALPTWLVLLAAAAGLALAGAVGWSARHLRVRRNKESYDEAFEQLVRDVALEPAVTVVLDDQALVGSYKGGSAQN